MTLTKVQPSDNKALADLIRKAFGEHHAPTAGTVYSDPTTDNLYELFKAERSVLWVAKEGEQVLGCCGIYPTPGLPEGHVELAKFYLLAEARGKGIGTKLMEQNIASAIELGYTTLYLESLPEFAKAVRMYERAGFERLDAPMGTSGHTSCNIWMTKQLGS